MSKKIILIVVVLVIVLAGGFFVYKSMLNRPSTNAPAGNIPGEKPEQKIVIDPLNATYIIEGKSVTLIAGKAEQEIVTGSASKLKTMAFGIPTKGDLNNDGIVDAALILTQNSGGSGTFYYAAAAVYNSKNGKTVGTNGILLGDRIAPQNVLINGETIVVNYADRNKGESMATPPSLGITKYFGVMEKGENETLFERPNTEKFNEYLKEAYLAKLPAGAKFDPSGIIKTTTFTAGEKFCQSLSMKKDIPANSFGSEVYNIDTGEIVQSKSTFPQALKQGGSVGCEDLQYSAGKYEMKLYIDDILVAILPFEVK